ncbi:3-hydroxyacyl-CoA dehydrogenase family protein [Luteitalea sp.]
MSSPLSVAVLGAGLMGHGIGQVLAAAGHRVCLTDTDATALGSALGRVTRNLEEAAVDAAPVLARMRTTPSLADAVQGVDLVIEAVAEVVALKQALFAEVAALAPPHAILASNTSVIPITRLGERLDDEARRRLVGTHWWNPPHLIPLVEVIRTAWTSAEVVDQVVTLLRDAGKTPVVVHRDVTGFIGNRLNQAMWREALALVEAGVCDAETIDIVVKSSFGLRLPVLGPMENADLIGLELTRNLHALLFPDLATGAAPSSLLDEAIARGDTGMKAGAGLRRWTPEEAEATRARLAAHLLALTRGEA